MLRAEQRGLKGDFSSPQSAIKFFFFVLVVNVFAVLRSGMRLVVAIQLSCVLLSFHLNSALSCDIADWWGALDRGPSWATCSKSNTYIRGFWRNDPSGNHGVWLLEEAKCCPARQGFANQLANCRNQDWGLILDR